MGRQGIRKRKKRNTNITSKRSISQRYIKRHLSWFSYGLVGFMTLSGIIMLCLCLTGCGHSFIHVDKGKGVVLRIPLPDGGSLVDFKMGMIDSTTAVIRGNTTYDSSASTGGASFTSAGTSDRIFLSTGMQLNEGYLKDVLTDPSVDTTTKVELAKAVAQMKPIPPLNTVTKTVSAATVSGGAASDIEPMKVGLDNVVDKVAQVAPKVVTPVADATKHVVKDVTTTVDTISNDWKTNVAIIAIAVVFVLIIIALVIYGYLRKRNNIDDIVVGNKSTTKNDEPHNTESFKDETRLQ